jgi:hypothetical protein
MEFPFAARHLKGISAQLVQRVRSDVNVNKPSNLVYDKLSGTHPGPVVTLPLARKCRAAG